MSKKIIALVLALALLVTVFAACGGDGGSSTSSQTESSNTEESSQAEESSTAEESSEGETTPTNLKGSGITTEVGTDRSETLIVE